MDWQLSQTCKRYASLHDYVDEINRSNPGTTCFVECERGLEAVKQKFKRFYMSFNALKKVLR